MISRVGAAARLHPARGDTLIGVLNLTAPGRVLSFRAADGLLLHDRGC